MKIGFVCPYAFGFGGVQEHILNLAKILREKGHKVKIIVPRHPNLQNPKIKEDFIFVGTGKDIALNGTHSYVSLGIHHEPKIKEIINRENFDILHFHQPDVPTISWFFLANSQTTNVVTLHHSGDYGPIEKAIYYLLTPTVLALAAKIHGRIAVSKTAQKHAQYYFPGNYHVIPNGINTKRFSPKGKKIEKYQPFGSAQGKINVLFVGRLEDRKGLIYLLKAFGKAKKEEDNLRLIIIGDGPKRSEYENLVKREKIADVEFVGEVLSRDLPSYYRTAHIFCAPSTYGESFGIVLLEAASSGLPIIATANSGYREFLADYPQRSLIVRPQDINSLKEAILKLSRDRELAKKLGSWGRRKVKKYSWEKISTQILEVYKKSQKQKTDEDFLGNFWLKKQILQVEQVARKILNLVEREL